MAAAILVQSLNLGGFVVAQDFIDSVESPVPADSNPSESSSEQDSTGDSQAGDGNVSSSIVENNNYDSQSNDNSTSSEPNSTSSASSGTNSTEAISDNMTAQASAGGSGSDQEQQVTETNSTSNGSLTNQNITSGVSNQTQTSNDVPLDNSTYTGNMTGIVLNQTQTSNDVPLDNSTYTGNMTCIVPNQTTTYNNSTEMPSDNVTESTDNSMLSNATDSIENTTALSVGPRSDFKISIDPITTSIKAGASTTFAVSVSSKNNFTSDVSLSISSRPISGITAYLSSNTTKPRPNAEAMSFLTVRSDSTAAAGTHKIKVTASSADIAIIKSYTVTLHVLGQNVTGLASSVKDQEFDPVAQSSIVTKDLQDNVINGKIFSKRMILISSTLNNNYDKVQPFVVIIEIRDMADHTTQYIQVQKGVLLPDGKAEVAVSWIPDKVGTYEVRSFAVDKLKDPEVLTLTVGKTIEVESQDTSTQEDYTSIERILRKW
jgi:hypothetical protein